MAARRAEDAEGTNGGWWTGERTAVPVQFKGRAIVFKDRGELLLLKFMKELEDVGVAEQMPKLEGRRMLVILSPKKTSKK